MRQVICSTMCLRRVLQASGFAQSRANLDGSDYIQQVFTIHEKNLPLLGNEDCQTHFQTYQPYGHHDTHVHAQFIACSARSILAEVQDFVALPAYATKIYLEADNERGLCHQLSYMPEIDLVGHEQFPKAYGNRSEESDGLIEQMERLERAAAYYMKTNLPVLEDNELEQLASHLQKYYQTCIQRCAERNRPFSRTDAESEDYLRECYASDSRGQLVASIGRNLGGIIRGHIEPLSIMTQDGMLGEFYNDNESVQHSYASLASLVGSLAFKKPTTRILKLGAGTGGASYPCDTPSL